MEDREMLTAPAGYALKRPDGKVAALFVIESEAKRAYHWNPMEYGDCVIAPVDFRDAAVTDAAERARYRFLLALLLDKGVIHQYPNGTWVLRGIYGVDDSGLRGAGKTPEQAIDNAILGASLIPPVQVAK